ncbi:MAG: cell division protein FtsZ [Porticoccus sp.]|jgi:cell division protein FtsZ|nr:cell division protein FtsZ [Porticoccus sp.]
MFHIVDNKTDSAEIRVVGVGGGGGNALKHMINSGVTGVQFICANTDAQALQDVDATILQIGDGLTKGLGAGANPDIGRQAAIEDRERISEALVGADMVFITAGMGGGTGTGAAPIVADIAKDLGILTVAVVTRPFVWEGKKRMTVAEEGLKELKDKVDSLITVPNEKLLEVLGRSANLLTAFGAANDVLLGAVKGIADLMIRPGLINMDFADVKAVMSEMGQAMMGTGEASGLDRAVEAAEKAIQSPLLEDINLQGAKGILVNITAGEDVTLGEFNDILEKANDLSSENATVVVGTVIDPSLENTLRVTVVATGLSVEEKPLFIPVEIDSEKSEEEINKGKISTAGEINWEDIERPTILRNGSKFSETDDDANNIENNSDNYLNIPAFLRSQAD